MLTFTVFIWYLLQSWACTLTYPSHPSPLPSPSETPIYKGFQGDVWGCEGKITKNISYSFMLFLIDFIKAYSIIIVHLSPPIKFRQMHLCLQRLIIFSIFLPYCLLFPKICLYLQRKLLCMDCSLLKKLKVYQKRTRLHLQITT